MDKNSKFAELVGAKWHKITTETDPDQDGWMWSTCSCGDKWSDNSIARLHRNPDYAADPRLVLREMKRLVIDSDFIEFATEGKWKYPVFTIVDYLLDETGLLRDKAIEFMEGRNAVDAIKGGVI